MSNVTMTTLTAWLPVVSVVRARLVLDAFDYRKDCIVRFLMVCYINWLSKCHAYLTSAKNSPNNDTKLSK